MFSLVEFIVRAPVIGWEVWTHGIPDRRYSSGGAHPAAGQPSATSPAAQFLNRLILSLDVTKNIILKYDYKKCNCKN